MRVDGRCIGLAAIAASTAACNAVLGISDLDSGSCDVAASFTLVAGNPTTTVLDHHMSGGTSLLFLLNQDAMPDAISLDLYDDMGGHGVVNAVGSYALTSGDAAFASCGICVALYADFDASSKTFSQTYFAVTQGTLVLDMFDTTGIRGSLHGLQFRQVDQSTGRDVANGCTVTIDDVEFAAQWSTSVAPGPALLHALRSAQ